MNKIVNAFLDFTRGILSGLNIKKERELEMFKSSDDYFTE